MNSLVQLLVKWECSRINVMVALVLLIHVYIWGTVVTCVIIPWFENSVPGVMNLGVITINTFMSMFCYMQCVMTDAGSVPEGWKPDEEGNQLVMQVKKKGGGVRFCQKCQLPKPPRCHHCRVCKRCVLRMDHHCPWVNNCIGHNNYKAFFLLLICFLTFAVPSFAKDITAAAIHAMALFSCHAINSIQVQARTKRMARYVYSASTRRVEGRLRLIGHENDQDLSPLWGIAQAICFALTFPITIGLLMLLGWHIYLVLNNKTTIEYHEGVTAKIQASKAGQQYQHPYDVGVCGNLHAVLGSNVACWLAPCPPAAEGPGVAYPTGIDPL